MNEQEQAIVKREVERFNMIPSFIWSFIFLFPLVVFCYTEMPQKWFIISLSISLLAVFLPKAFFNELQVSKSHLFYKKAGVDFTNKFIQNGTILNRFIKNKFPDYKRFSNKEEAVKKLFNQTYMFEKFHFILFIFFCETMLFAVFHGFYIWAFFLLVANIFYNMYPILLQQYIRIRILSLINKTTNGRTVNK